MFRRLAMLSALCVCVACGVPEDEHNAILQDLENTRIELSDVQRTNAENLTKLKALEDAGNLAAERITQLSAKETELTRQLQETKTALGASKDALAIYESKAGSLEQRLKSTKTELIELRKAREIAERRAAQYRKLNEKFASMVASGKLTVKIRGGKMVIQLDNAILFDPGKVKLRKAGQEALVEIAKILQDFSDRQFLVAGHTDNVPVSGKKFGSNWALSTARAVEVVSFLQTNGVDPKAMAAAGYGEHDPVAPNDTAESRTLNRRIEIILMPNLDELPKLPSSKS